MRLGATSLSVTKPGSARQYAAAASSGSVAYTALPDIDTYSHVRFDQMNTSTNPVYDCQVKSDGTKFWTMHRTGSTTAMIYEQNLSTAWDISTHGSNTASLNTYSYQPNGQCYTFMFTDNGSKLYLGGITGDVTHLELSTPWDLSSTVTNVRMTDVGARVNGLFWKHDGTVFYYIDSINDKIYSKTVSTAWDLSTITSTASSSDLSYSSQISEYGPMDLYIGGDGLKVYIVGSQNDKVFQYNLSTAWDITEVSGSADEEFSVYSQETAPYGIDFSPDGTHMYVSGGSGDGVDQYTSS